MAGVQQVHLFGPGGRQYNNATISLRAFVRCAQIVDGTSCWSNPCPVRLDTGRPAKPATLGTSLGRDNRKPNGDWDVVARIDAASVNNAPSVKGAKYCYSFIVSMEGLGVSAVRSFSARSIFL